MSRINKIIVSDVNWAAAIIIAFGFMGSLFFFPNSTGPTVAASAALVVALVIYPWQKERDRRLKVLEEKRAAYKNFLEASSAYISFVGIGAFRQSTTDGFSENYIKTVSAAYALLPYAPTEVLEAVQAYVEKAAIYETGVRGLIGEESYQKYTDRASNESFEQLRKLRFEAAARLRSDSLPCSLEEARTAMKKFFTKTNHDLP